MESVLATMESTAAQQLGLITLAQLLEAGVHQSRVYRLLASGTLRHERRGVYAVAGAPGTWERGLLAAVLAVDDSVASHSSAARLWEFRYRVDDYYEVTVPRPYRAKVSGVRVHRSTLFEDDAIKIRGVPCTSFERTLCDCTASLSKYQLSHVLDDGLRRGVAALPRLALCAEELDSGPGRRMSVVRSLLGERGFDYDPGGSRSERRLLDLYRKARLPPPVQQYPVSVGGKSYVLDYAWPALKVFGEWYGLPWHSGSSAVAYDSERVTALVADGWLPLIFTDTSSDRRIIEQTIAVLRQRQVGTETSA
jgi:putative AbiEi antitoxin of type IV toxin-antitoxin system